MYSQFHQTKNAIFMDSLHSSLSRPHPSHLRFFRCNSFIIYKYHCFSKCQNHIHHFCTSGKCLEKKTELVSTSQCLSQSHPSTRWIEKWNVVQKRIHRKKPRPVFSYNQSDTDTPGSEAIDAARKYNRLERIMESLRKGGYAGDSNGREENPPKQIIEKGSVEDILFVEDGILPNAQGGFSAECPFGVENMGKNGDRIQFPWEKPKKVVTASSDWKLDKTCMAELILSKSEMRRLQMLAFKTTVKRIKGAGVTPAMVDSIHEKWRSSEIVRLRIEGPLSNDMKSMHEVLERRTGGLVIWRCGTSVALYRGEGYGDPSENEALCEHLPNAVDRGSARESSSELKVDDVCELSEGTLIADSNQEGKVRSVRKQQKKLAAVSILPESELMRLRSPAFQPLRKLSVKGSHITEDIVNAIHEKWKRMELVRLKFQGRLKLNMGHIVDTLEKKTGGLVIWRTPTFITLYRGVNYKAPLLETGGSVEDESTSEEFISQEFAHAAQEEGAVIKSPSDVSYVDEMEKLLNELGPRYADWQGYDPLPVDADMLPDIPDYQPPLRILPYGAKASLSPGEATALRRLSRPIPPHFAIGRSRRLRGLAGAMVKLWEKSAMAKIALKRGVSLITNEMMLQELRKLTGGILLTRCKGFFTFYRGKNFLAREVAETLLEWEGMAKALQDEEAQARISVSPVAMPDCEIIHKSSAAGTLGETIDADARWRKPLDDQHKKKVLKETKALQVAFRVKGLERLITSVKKKIIKAEVKLAKVEKFMHPKPLPGKNVESITDEERFMFRKLGLRMGAYLEMGKRGIFDGTVENIHLHWKYRSLVKILLNAGSLQQANELGSSLEAESGGVLVSVDKGPKRYSIILFRGRNYRRPSIFRPKNLLDKRKALLRCTELQRRRALKCAIAALRRNAARLKYRLGQMCNSDSEQSCEESDYNSAVGD